MLDTLPEPPTVARQRKTPHQDFLLLALSNEAERHESQAGELRAQRAHLDPEMRFERWDETARVTLDRTLLNELATLCFLQGHRHVAIVGPVDGGKTFCVHALGHVASQARPDLRQPANLHVLADLGRVSDLLCVVVRHAAGDRGAPLSHEALDRA